MAIYAYLLGETKNRTQSTKLVLKICRIPGEPLVFSLYCKAEDAGSQCGAEWWE